MIAQDAPPVTYNALPVTTAPIVTKEPDFDGWKLAQSSSLTELTTPLAPIGSEGEQSSAVIGGSDGPTTVIVAPDINWGGVAIAVGAAVVIALSAVVLLILKNKKSK